MKRIFYGLVAALCGFGGIAWQHDSLQPGEQKPKCIGYTVLEVGKAIDCNGDTIRLTKRSGFYQLASN
jgi:hypothetical protein